MKTNHTQTQSRNTWQTPLLISFWQDTPKSVGYYQRESIRFSAECERVGQPATIVERNYGNEYLAITRAKPAFMLEMLNLYQGQDLVFVDVDSRIIRRIDFQYNRIAWATKPDGKPYGHVHYLPNTPETIEFLEAWQSNTVGWEGGDHSALWLTLQQTGYVWEPIKNIGTRIRFGTSQTEDSKTSLAYLESIDWPNTLARRLHH